jgi:hypothetical protein
MTVRYGRLPRGRRHEVMDSRLSSLSIQELIGIWHTCRVCDLLLETVLVIIRELCTSSVYRDT